MIRVLSSVVSVFASVLYVCFMSVMLCVSVLYVRFCVVCKSVKCVLLLSSVRCVLLLLLVCVPLPLTEDTSSLCVLPALGVCFVVRSLLPYVGIDSATIIRRGNKTLQVEGFAFTGIQSLPMGDTVVRSRCRYP